MSFAGSPDGGGGVADHGALTGLSDDDHTQYLLVNGSRAMTGQLQGTSLLLTSTGQFGGNVRCDAVAPTQVFHLTRKDYVDTADGLLSSQISTVSGKLSGNGGEDFLVVFESGNDGSMKSQNEVSIDPATSVLRHVYNSATQPETDIPVYRMVKDGEPEDTFTDATTDSFAEIQFRADDSTGAETEYAYIGAVANFTLNGFECGRLALGGLNQGTPTDAMYVEGGGFQDGTGTKIGPLVRIEGYLDFPNSGTGLMVRGNRAAFVYREDNDAGLFFSIVSPASFEFRRLTGTVVAEIMADSETGGVRTAAGNTGNAGFDAVSAGVMAFGLNNATAAEFYCDIDLADGENVQAGTTTGSKIGTGATQKLGFWNATPVVQPTAIADASGGSTVDAEARAAINDLLSKLRDIGIIAT